MVLAASFATMAIVRALTELLPFRPRPMHEESLHLRTVAELWPGSLESASSMPSDHAGLFFALAFGLWAVSRPMGIAALFHALVLVALPRLHLGFHCPSDLLVGAAVGALVAWWMTRAARVERIGTLALGRVERWPAAAYAGLFLVTSQMAEMFDPLRTLLGWLRIMLLT